MPLLDIFDKRNITTEKAPEIIVDHREKNSLVPAALISFGAKLKWEQLPVADYLINGTAIERKTVSDLKGSIINKRIISQLADLKQYDSHLLIIEGIIEEDIYSGQIHENALRGFLLSVSLDYHTPVIFTHSPQDTAKYLLVLAKRKDKPESSIRASKIALTKEEQIQFILEGFPNVGPSKAKALIEKFHSLQQIFNAREEELREILGTRANLFKNLLDWQKK
jgi:ERCC4-type nuclease